MRVDPLSQIFFAVRLYDETVSDLVGELVCLLVSIELVNAHR